MASSGYATTTETELDLCCDGNQLGYMENLNIPFNLNVNFDEIPHDKSGSSGSLITPNGSMNNKNKRPIVDNQSDASKKRFVWPDALHRDFLAAVFDIGLKYASPKEVAALMSEQDSSVSMDQMKSHIQKFMMFRERKEGEYVSYSDQERGVVATGPSYAASPHTSEPPTSSLATAYGSNANFGDYANEIKSEAEWSGGAGFGIAFPKPASRDPSSSKITKIANTRPFQGRPNISIPPTVLLAKIDTMGEAINAQSAHLANIKQLIKKQTKLYMMLSQKANQLKATLPSDLLNPPSYNAFLSNAVRNTCSSLYPMNVVTGDSTFGLSYIDATSRNQFNDSFNYNYTANANTGPEGSSEGVVNLNYLRDSATANDATLNSNNTRNGFQFMHEMRTHMDTHRKLLLRKEDQLSQHGGCDVVSNLYVHDDSCTSGYNSFSDQYKHKEYVYTEEDNRLCFPNGRKPDDAPVNSDFGITGLGRPPAVNQLTIRHYNNSNNVYPSSGGVRAGYISSNSSVRSASVRSGRSGRSGRSSKRDEPSTSSVLGYYYGVSQATKAALATRTTSGSSATTGNSSSSAASVGMFRPGENSSIPPAYAFNSNPLHSAAHSAYTTHTHTTSNPVTSASAAEGDWDSELDLESDLFSFLFDPTAM